jgi:hypothetical protein
VDTEGVLSVTNVHDYRRVARRIYNRGTLNVSRSNLSRQRRVLWRRHFQQRFPGQGDDRQQHVLGQHGEQLRRRRLQPSWHDDHREQHDRRNTAPDGNGVGVDEGGTVTTLINTILISDSNINCGGGGPVTNGGNNIDSGTSCGFGSADGSLSNTNPLIGPLLFNVPGETQTFALMPGSPALGAAKASACPATDQRASAVRNARSATSARTSCSLRLRPSTIRAVVGLSPELGGGMGHQLRAPGQDDLRDVVHVWSRRQAYVGRRRGGRDFARVCIPATSSQPRDRRSIRCPSIRRTSSKPRFGTATFTFTDDNHGTFAYTIDTGSGIVTQTKSITKQQFGTLPVCVWGAKVDLAFTANFTDLWWNVPPGSEAGWGINFSHQGNVIFATWFTYDASGKGWWLAFVANKTGPGVYSGDVFTTTGPPFNAVPWDTSLVVETTIGTATLTFTDGNHATFAYTVNGVSQTKTITRQVFAPPGTACN